MKRFFRLLLLEWKRALRALPLMFAEAVFMCAFLAAAFFLCQKLFFGEAVFQKIPVGIVVSGENRMTELALQYLEGMESTAAVCEFRRLTLDEGRRELDAGRLAALMVLPEEMLESILDSRNYPVRVYFPKDSSVEALLLRELTEAGAGMLSMAQAEIYAIYDMSMNYQQMEELTAMQEDINLLNMRFAMARERLVRKNILEISGEVPLMLYYAAAGVTLFLMLWGIACGKFLKEDTPAFGGQLIRSGTARWQWMLCKLMGAVFILGAGTAVMTMLLLGLSGDSFNGLGITVTTGGGSAWLLLPALLCIAAMLLFCYQAASGRSSGMLMIFIITIVMIFISGGFVPSVFLPSALRSAAEWLPCNAMILAACKLLGADITTQQQSRAVLLLLVWSALFFAAALRMNRIREEA